MLHAAWHLSLHVPETGYFTTRTTAAANTTRQKLSLSLSVFRQQQQETKGKSEDKRAVAQQASGTLLDQ